jgi:ribosomal protein S6--L-glutamate ligase
MRIAFFVKPRGESGAHSVVREVLRILTGRGLDVDLIDPEARVIDLTALRLEYDLYVLKARTDTTLSVAGALHAAGARILNPYPVAAACRDKVVGSRLLLAAGVPVPETYVAGRLDQLAPLLESGALVVKPYRGSQGRGVRIVRTIADLEGDSHDGGPVFAQRYYEPRGLDRKVYRIGAAIFGVERVWPARTYEEKVGQPLAVDDEIRELALRLGDAFGITLYGFDVVPTDDGPYVVDFSPFPGFKGVPDAAALLADYVEEVAARVVKGSPMLAAEAREPLLA